MLRHVGQTGQGVRLGKGKPHALDKGSVSKSRLARVTRCGDDRRPRGAHSTNELFGQPCLADPGFALDDREIPVEP